MMTVNVIVILLVFFSIFNISISQDVDSDEQLTTTSSSIESSQNTSSCSLPKISANEKRKCCENLNENRANFTSCCEYPMLVVYTSQRNECAEKCKENSIPPSNCCILNCCLKKINVMNASEERSEINAESFSYSFLNSVKHASKWTYPIMSSVATCYNEIAVDTKKLMSDEIYWTCEGKVPKYFYKLVDCAYERNFLNCPRSIWNLRKYPECEITRQYVSECLAKPAIKTEDETTNLLDYD